MKTHLLKSQSPLLKLQSPLLKLQSHINNVGLILCTAMLLSLFAWTSATAGVADTNHNLGSGGPGSNKFSGTTEVCVFCHTPHGGDTSAAVPLWNRTLPAPGTYATYDSLGTSSLDGSTAPVGSVSIACLSCHDGVQAMDAVLNEPGSGAVVSSYNSGSWTGSANPGGIANLGQNLTDDHPIGIQYGGGGITDGSPSAATTDPDFATPGNAAINGRTVWWVDTEGTPNGLREKTDMQLYTRSVAGISGGADQPFVECASCHDPHSDANPTFLRVSNEGSAVCLACHVK